MGNRRNYTVGVISDTHMESKCCRAFVICHFNHESFKEFVSSGKLHKSEEMAAKYFVPYFSLFTKEGHVHYYFRCTAFIDDRCSIYNKRPNVCREFKFDKSVGCEYENCLTECRCNGAYESLGSILTKNNEDISEDKKANYPQT